MPAPRTRCPGLFVCAAILCWDSRTADIFFVNVTDCTPSPLYFASNVRLIPQKLPQSLSPTSHAFVCSNCTSNDSFADRTSRATRCQRQQPTTIELMNYCEHRIRSRPKKDECQCTATNRSIKPITNWAEALVDPGKSHWNIVRANKINGSSPAFVYILMGIVALLVLTGGLVGVVFYWIQLRPTALQTVK